MGKLSRLALGGLVVLGGCGDSQSQPGATETTCPATTAAALNPPPDATLKVALAARGAQIYGCTAGVAGAPPAWSLTAPHAVLSHAGGEEAAIHFAGPSWQALDGSLVTGARTASAPGIDATAIPWLLLKAATHGGTGLFDDITWIQRLETVGGVAPTTGCDAAHLDAQVLVPYTADYFFYQPAGAGAAVRQCASPP